MEQHLVGELEVGIHGRVGRAAALALLVGLVAPHPVPTLVISASAANHIDNLKTAHSSQPQQPSHRQPQNCMFLTVLNVTMFKGEISRDAGGAASSS